jgi:DNA-binding transcriptional MerR regulator
MRMATNMINPEEKLKALLIKMRHINELLERKMKTTEEEEKQYLQEEIKKTLTAMKQDNKDGNLAFAKQKEIGEYEFYQLLVDSLGAKQAEELCKEAVWDMNMVTRAVIRAFAPLPKVRQKLEEEGFTLEDIEDIIRLNSNLLPNAENAVVDIRKLRDYSLNRDHSTGKDKARLFSSILGMTAENAEELRQIILEKVKTQEVSLNRYDEHGQRYTLDFTLEWQNRSATIRTGWIIKSGSDIPRLTSCYPLL